MKSTHPKTSKATLFSKRFVILIILLPLIMIFVTDLAISLYQVAGGVVGSADYKNMLSVVFSELLVLPVACILISRHLKKTGAFWRDIGIRKAPVMKSLRYIGIFYAAWIIFFFVLSLLVLLITQGQPLAENHETLAHPIAKLPLHMQLFLAVLCAPIIEEITYRGILFNALIRRYKLSTSIILSALIFAIIHLDPMVMLITIPLSIWTVIMYRRLGSIIPGIILHASWNLIVTLIKNYQ